MVIDRQIVLCEEIENLNSWLLLIAASRRVRIYISVKSNSIVAKAASVKVLQSIRL